MKFEFISAHQILEIAKTLPTPFYVYNLKTIEERYLALTAAFNGRFQILYSMKANPHREILSRLRELGAFLDVSSLGELKRARALDFSADRLSFVAPGKTRQELEASVDEGLYALVAESLNEVKKIEDIARTRNTSVDVCLRVSPTQYLAPHGRAKKNHHFQFGIAETELPGVVDYIKNSEALGLQGLHFFVQSHFLEAKTLIANFVHFLHIAQKTQERYGADLTFLNLGGGFGIPYFTSQSDLNLLELSAGIRDQVEPCLSAFPKAKMHVESGRFVAGPAGLFVTQILDKKTAHDHTYLICDGGMTQHMAATLAGQTLHRPFPLKIVQNPEIESEVQDRNLTEQTVSLAGPSCYAADLLASDVSLPLARVGDWVTVGQSGSYGATFSPQNFLSRPAPGEICILD